MEEAAIKVVKKRYQKEGWKVTDVSKENRGYDLLGKKKSKELNIEVKGVQGSLLSFIITPNEVRQAKKNGNFILCIVTNSLTSNPSLDVYTGAEFLQQFILQPLSYYAKFIP